MKSLLKPIILFIFFTSIISCKESKPNQQSNKKNNPEEKFAMKPESWISERVDKAEKKTSSTEAGKLLWKSIKSHGGLDKWFRNGPISFRFDYVPVSNKNAKKTIQQIDTWSNRAVHQSIDDTEDTFGWDGKNAWVKRNDTLSFKYDTRFWALTPYYFIGQPFIFDGQGVKLEKLNSQFIDSIEYDAIKISFEAGTGDAPDDYYVNYYDKNSHLLKAIKYIVSYPKRFNKGEHSPEKLMIITSYQKIDGIKLAKTYETYSTNEQGQKDQLMTNSTVSQVKFLPKINDDYFSSPEGAFVVE